MMHDLNFPRISLRWRMGSMIVLVIALLAFLVLLNEIRVREEQNNNNLRQAVAQTSLLLNITFTPLSTSSDLTTLATYLDEMLPRKINPAFGVSYIVLLNTDGSRILNAGMAPTVLPPPTEQVDVSDPTQEVHVRQRILLPDNKVGYLQFGFAFRGIIESSALILKHSMLLAGMGVVALGGILFFLGDRLARRIESLTHSARAIESGNLQHRAVITGNDEITELGEHFNHMAIAVGERISELETAKAELARMNDELEAKIVERTVALERAHKELVHTEKLTSLGSMVAGISHELNTPIGNALTIATTLDSSFKEMTQRVSDGTVRRSTLHDFLTDGTEMAQLATRSIRKAAELVSSFKQVAADQTSEQRRQFDLSAVIDDNINSVRHFIKKTPLTIANQVPKGVICDSYPGPLGQIVTNILLNAAIHATADRDVCMLKISAECLDDSVTIYFADDGVGMEEAVLLKIFDPFFTTKLGKGGSGLGLSVSHRIATAILGGTLTATSAIGLGTTFKLTIPTVLPFGGLNL